MGQSCELRMRVAEGTPFWARIHGTVMESPEDNISDLPLTHSAKTMADDVRSICTRHQLKDTTSRLQYEIFQVLI